MAIPHPFINMKLRNPSFTCPKCVRRCNALYADGLCSKCFDFGAYRTAAIKGEITEKEKSINRDKYKRWLKHQEIAKKLRRKTRIDRSGI